MTLRHIPKFHRIRSWLHMIRLFIANNRLFSLLLAIFVVIGLLVGVVRYQTYLDGFDYAVFTQTLWHYSTFSAPHSSIRDVNWILGDHFHPLLVILTPLFWVWNNPLVLVTVQPITFALSAIPIYLLAKKHFGRNSSLLLSAAYLSSHGLQFALFFDFHEIALAVPLVSLLIYAIDKEKYRSVIICCVLLCLIKEELVLLSAMAGLVLILKNHKYKLGGAIFFGSLFFFAALTKLIMPLFAGKGRYNDYWTYGSYGTGVGDVIKNAAPAPTDFITKVYHNISQNQTKTDTLWVFVLSSGFTVFFSWYALLALPNLLVRMLSDAGTFYWSYWFHYGAILMPIIFFCIIDVLRKIQKRAPKKYCKRLITTLCVAVCAYSFGLMLDKNLPYAQVFNPEFYSLNHQVQSGEQEVKQIVGDKSSITAPVVIMPHFANRESINLLTDKGRWYVDEPTVLTDPPATDYIVLNDKLPITDVDPSYDYADLRRDVEEIDYHLLYSNPQTGWIIYQKAR